METPASTENQSPRQKDEKARLHRSVLGLIVIGFVGLSVGAFFAAPVLYHKFTAKKPVDTEAEVDANVAAQAAEGEEGEVDVAHGHESEHQPEGHEAEDSQAAADQGEHSDEHAADHGTKKGKHAAKVVAHSRLPGQRAEFEPGFLSKILGAYGSRIESFQFKLAEIQDMDDRLARLETENLHLRSLLERNQYECRLAEANTHQKEVKGRLIASTRTSVGRTLASIDYKIPEHLLPSQLYTLAISYLQARDDEKAVKILNHLQSLQDVDTYRNAKDYLLAGVAWYRVDNLVEADFNFGKVLEFPEDATVLPYFAQARLWRAVVAERGGQASRAQGWMRELVDHHPHSPEAQWVNARAPASVKKTSEKPKQEAKQGHEAHTSTHH